MHSLYNFVSGPLTWVAFIVFVGGCIFRVAALLRMVHRKEKFIYSYMSWKYSLRSILHWITPFGTENWRRHPYLTIVTFAFHICLIITPIFLLAHVILWQEAFDVSWWTLPDSVAQVTTLIVIAGCVFFLVRRFIRPEVQYVTSASDYVMLAIVAAPFVTGFLAYYQWLDYQIIIILHILAGQIMLVAIPFSRLSHMMFSLFTRAYMGSEFGAVRHARDW